MTVRSNTTELIRRSFGELMKNVATSIPGHFLAFDPATQLAQIQIGIRTVDVNGKSFEPAPVIECPVAFLGGSKFCIEHQIDPGDECWILFSQRCIDGWRETGGVANNPIMRFHDISDAAVIPGVRSQSNKINGFQNNGVRLRNEDGSQFIWLKNDGTAAITVDTLNIVANVTIEGDIDHTGTQTTSEDVIANGISLVEHVHGAGAYKTTSGTPIDPLTKSGEPE